jgi:hypothetical protein
MNHVIDSFDFSFVRSNALTLKIPLSFDGDSKTERIL